MIEQLLCKLSVILTDYLPWNYLNTVQLCMYGEGNTGDNYDEGNNCTGIRHNDNWLIQYYTYTDITIIIASFFVVVTRTEMVGLIM